MHGFSAHLEPITQIRYPGLSLIWRTVLNGLAQSCTSSRDIMVFAETVEFA